MVNYRLYRNFGICYEQIDNQTEAENALLKAIELNPQDAIALNYLAIGGQMKIGSEKAITFIQKAVQLQPYSGYYADSLGWVYYRQGAFDKAVLWLEKAIQLTLQMRLFLNIWAMPIGKQGDLLKPALNGSMPWTWALKKPYRGSESQTGKRPVK